LFEGIHWGDLSITLLFEGHVVGRWDQRRGRTRQSDGCGTPTSWRSYNHSLRMLDDNDCEAFRLNQLAAQDGMHDAVLAMGWFYLNGVGIKADKEEAIRGTESPLAKGMNGQCSVLVKSAFSMETLLAHFFGLPGLRIKDIIDQISG
jgi:hypothetical protein